VDTVRDYQSIGISQKLLVIGGYKTFKQWHDTVAVVRADPLATGTASLQGYTLSELKNPDGSSAGFLQPALQHGPSPENAHFLVNTAAKDTLVVWAIDPEHPGDLYRAGVPVLTYASPKLPEQRPHAELVHPQLINPVIAGAIVLKTVFRNGKLHACWQDSKPNDTRQLRFVHLVRVDVSSFPQGIPRGPGSGLIDRRFGKSAVSDAPGAVSSYYMPTLAVNADGAIVLNYCRCGPDVFPEARYSVYLNSDADIQPSHLVHAGEYPVGSEDPDWTAPIDQREAAKAGVLDYLGITVDPTDDRTVWIINAFGSKKAKGVGQYKLVVKRIVVTGRNPQIFAYNFNTKAGTVGYVTTDGKIAVDEQQGPGAFGEWTHIVSIGDGRVFFYNETKGSGAVGHLAAAGTIATEGQQGPGSFGKWTHIVGFGDGRVFFYNETKGSGAVGHLAAAGTIATDGQQGPGSFGKWTHIVGFGDGRIFFYNETKGSGAVGHLAAAGTIATDGQQGPGSFGKWTILSAL